MQDRMPAWVLSQRILRRQIDKNLERRDGKSHRISGV